MKKMKRILASILSAGVALTAFAGCSSEENNTATTASTGGTAQETLDVKFGYIADYNGASLVAIASEQGLWEKHGLNVETVSFTNGPLQIQALGTGDLDYGYIGNGAMWLPASGQASVIMINAVGEADRVIAQPGIDSIEDLKGKKVAIPEGTSGDTIVQRALQEAGMTIDDIEKVAMDASTVVSAFASGQVDAAGIWYPLVDTIKAQVPDLVELAKNTDYPDLIAPSAFVAGVEPDAEKTTRVLKALREANDWRAANLDEAVRITSDFTAVDAEAMKNDASHAKYYSSAELDTMTEDGTIEGWLQSMNDANVAAGKIKGDPVAPAEFYHGDEFVAAGK